jgi:hypothetical protein
MFVVVTLVRSSDSLRTVGDVAADVRGGGNLQWAYGFQRRSVLFEDVQG